MLASRSIAPTVLLILLTSPLKSICETLLSHCLVDSGRQPPQFLEILVQLVKFIVCSGLVGWIDRLTLLQVSAFPRQLARRE